MSFDNNENLVRAKWGIFMSEGEDWEVLGEIEKYGQDSIRNFSHLSAAKVCKKVLTILNVFADFY